MREVARVPGLRGWLDLRESLMRLMEMRNPPAWARVLWSVQYLWKVRRAEIHCYVTGHEWTADRIGPVCRRCCKSPNEV